MKYAIQVLMRFDKKDERDNIAGELMKKLKKRFEKDDAFIQLHKCYHDEKENKPCEVEKLYKAV